MIGQATAHRRANAFAQALEEKALEDTPVAGAPDGSQGGHGSHHGGARGEHGGTHGAHAAARHADPDQAALVALAAAISSRPRPVMDAEKKTVQRAQLIAAMEQAIADGSFAEGRVPEQRTETHHSHRATGLGKLTPRSRLSRRLAVGGLSVSVAAGALGGVAAASTDALPGDTLYGLKRGMEDLKLDMANGDASRGQVYLDMAATRMQEARRLMDRGRGGDLDPDSVAEVRKALSGMHQEVAEAHRLLTQAYQDDGSLQPMEMLNTFAQNHRQGWTDLRGKLPSQLTDVSDQVSSVLAAIDQEVAPLKLPKTHDSSGRASSTPNDSQGSDGTGGTPSGSAAPSTSASAGGRTTGTGTPSASPSGTADNGLIGGSNLLNPNPSSSSPTGTPTGTPTGQNHSVVLPPLLPGLLPGLGLTSDTDAE
ncbi:hypothetical protein SAMN05216267_1018175 [Actinacidiphila rubida]|uniref:DUF5667 domain-containing protein n=1 Tax=Actinacidiphila rubida TaxID=310780 RepID=A0A1H8MF27_9ACTN|nr:DUF5667 domain-containing protein [Actinacidiphila rubida]SEO15828.1 hypothetical protein SAMN05216267_1018175 [Actinacidiphila rubida]